MNLIILHRNGKSRNDGASPLEFAFTTNPLASVVMYGFAKYGALKLYRNSFWHLLKDRHTTDVLFAVPREWSVQSRGNKNSKKIVSCDKQVCIPEYVIDGSVLNRGWHTISNGRFFTAINRNLLVKVLDKLDADVISVNVAPGLLGEKEKVRLTAQGKLAGFRRQYSDCARLCPVPGDWPAHLFVRSGIFRKILTGSSLSSSFSEMLETCRVHSLKVCAADLGGLLLDMETEEGLLEFSRLMLGGKTTGGFKNSESAAVSPNVRLFGKLLLGENVRIGSEAVLAGPVIIGDNVVIEERAVIHSSIIGSGSLIRRGDHVHNQVVQEGGEQMLSDDDSRYTERKYDMRLGGSESRFRTWPVLSYARFVKRIADIFVASVVLILFAPLIPLIAAAIKLTSPGSIFYKDKRQGLHGKEFNCLKFRTMIPGANKIQENLRFVSQVDGPQFKMADDPRISLIGRFLRETYIDEIPQFFNVLLGQMSVVGPRPSPESENTLCPFWRDARLSVRPGITGLWQLYRTRRPLKDFQEWIHYDVEYVRNLSLKTDLKVCWKTAKKLIDNFISQF